MNDEMEHNLSVLRIIHRMTLEITRVSQEMYTTYIIKKCEDRLHNYYSPWPLEITRVSQEMYTTYIIKKCEDRLHNYYSPWPVIKRLSLRI